MTSIVLALALGTVIGVAVAFGVFRWRSANASQSAPTEARDDGIGRLLSEAIDHLEIGVVIADRTGRLVYRNSAAAVFSGTHVGLLLDEHLATISAEARGGERALRVVDLYGPPRTWLELAADPMPDGGAVTTIRDVSERIRTDAMRTDFVANISHELKTPVGAIAVLAEALIDEQDVVLVGRLSDHLVEESHRAVKTIDDLLKLSQIESSSPSETPVDLASVVDQAVARGRAVDAGRGVVVTALDVPHPLWINGDERQLVSAVGNLVENAVKYSRPGGIVQVRTRIDEHVVEVMVADQGIGIPARDLDRIFERFYRVDKARSRNTGGTGLGLSIVRHVATNHGGDVIVSSHEGDGSTFVLRLPASVVTTPPQPAATRDASSAP